MHKPISSVYGEITRMLLTYPEQINLPNDITLQRYKGIFESLGANIEYIILAHRNTHESIRQTAIHAGLDPDTNLKLISAFSLHPAFVRRILSHVSGNVYQCELDNSWHSIWAQDGYCCLKKDTGETVLIEPLDFARGGDNFVADQIAAETNIEIEITKYHLEGGNVLAGDDYIIVGKDYLHHNERITGESHTEITNGFKKLFGVSEIIWLGFESPLRFPIDVPQGTYQPIFHIDMYVTLGGKTVEGKELVFVGDPELAKKILGQPAPSAEIIQAFNKTAEFFESYSDDIEFEVVRLPLDLWDVTPKSGTFLTYNNCLIESFDNARNVYLPAYASVAPGSLNRRRLDEKAAQVFQDAGFATKLLTGAYEELCKRGGSIHCITKALDRRIS